LILATSCRDFLGSDDDEQVRSIQDEKLSLNDPNVDLEENLPSSEDGFIPPHKRNQGNRNSTDDSGNNGEYKLPTSDEDDGLEDDSDEPILPPQNMTEKKVCLEDQALNKFVIPSNPTYRYYNDRSLCRFPAKNQKPSSSCIDQFDESQLEKIELKYGASPLLQSPPSQRLIGHYISPHKKYQVGIGARPQSGANFFTYATFNLTRYINPGERLECISLTYTSKNTSSLITTDSNVIRTTSCEGKSWDTSDPRYNIWGIKHQEFIPKILASTPVGKTYTLDLNLGDLMMKDGSRVNLVESLNTPNPNSEGRCLEYFSQDDQDIQKVTLNKLTSR
ncbi:hypothetical protein N9N67_11725, partial [Bacteriovoracaceae bacterium]|nr:hypothetical protein [Bacteriovoracaceae bacterium]